MDEAASPFPSEDTTPPVTKIYFGLGFYFAHVVIPLSSMRCSILLKSSGMSTPKDSRSVTTTLNPVALFQCAKLFKLLRHLEGRLGHCRIGEQKVPAVHVQPDVLVTGGSACAEICKCGLAGPPVAVPGDGSAGKIQRIPLTVHDHLDHVRSRASAGSVISFASVPMGMDGSSASGLTAASIMPGSMSGSSPCTFTTISQSRDRATSAIRSVPVACPARSSLPRRRTRPRPSGCGGRPWPQ